MWAMFGMWQLYFYSGICQIFMHYSLLNVLYQGLCIWHMCIHPIYIHVKYVAYKSYMPNLVGIFVSGTYLANG